MKKTVYSWLAVCALLTALVFALGLLSGSRTVAQASNWDSVGQQEQLVLPGLRARVDIVRDNRGFPHIYGENMHDVLLAEGYLMSKDRFPQMEVIRRGVTGRLAEALGEGQFEGDQAARRTGFLRMGRRIYESLSATDPARLATEAFVDGINAYIDDVKSGFIPTSEVIPPGGDTFRLITTCACFTHWHPSDVFAMARYQAYALSYDADSDVTRTTELTAVRRAFPPNSANPVLASRAGFYSDLWSHVQARRDYTQIGYPNLQTDTGTRAFNPGQFPFETRRPAPLRPEVQLPEVSQRLLADTAKVTNQLREMFAWVGDEHRGSNNWLVARDRASGNAPILANDPHLSLGSPGIWWHVHLNTMRARGAAATGGEESIDAEGVAFAGLPGVVLGFNESIAWGATTTGYDVTDAYLETVTPGANGAPGTVLFNGAQVPLVRETEQIAVLGDTAPRTVTFDFVPHHGVIVSRDTTNNTAVSFRYTGDVVTNELSFFVKLLWARNVAQAATAQNDFRVGSQNFIFIDRENIRWSSGARIPQREAAGCNINTAPDGTITGTSPMFMLPGTGGAEWTQDLDPRYIPHAQNPQAGFIATANQDNVGVTDDGNPCNDTYYIGGDFDQGWRQHRIVERLQTLAARGNVTTAEMIELQAASKSSAGERLRDPIVAILANPALAIPTLTADELSALARARTLLMSWSLETPAALDLTSGAAVADAAVLRDSRATTLFNVALARMLPRAFGDEIDKLNEGQPADNQIGRPTSEGLRLLEWAVTEPSRLYSFNQALNDTVLWDDISTVPVETKAQIIIRSILDAYTILRTRLGSDENAWLWGKLHTVRFGWLLPPGDGPIAIPTASDATFPNGFPRHGDYGAVDVGNFGLWLADPAGPNAATLQDFSFRHGSGASQRLVVQMTADGPVAFNALPGGEVIDNRSPYHANEAQHWIRNEAPRVWFTEAEVRSNAVTHIAVSPGARASDAGIDGGGAPVARGGCSCSAYDNHSYSALYAALTALLFAGWFARRRSR